MSVATWYLDIGPTDKIYHILQPTEYRWSIDIVIVHTSARLIFTTEKHSGKLIWQWKIYYIFIAGFPGFPVNMLIFNWHVRLPKGDGTLLWWFGLSVTCDEFWVPQLNCYVQLGGYPAQECPHWTFLNHFWAVRTPFLNTSNYKPLMIRKHH